MIYWHALDKKEVISSLKSNENGLSEHESFIRLEKYGKNELRQIHKINPILIFLQQFKSIFTAILLFAAIFSFVIKHYIDFFVIVVIILANAIIGFIQQYKAEKTIAEMRNLLVPKIKVFRDNRLQEVNSTEIVPGDIISISEGDKIMADCRILQSNELETNEAILTGESFSQSKSSDTIKFDIELANRENMLYMGTVAVRGSARAIVVETGMNTEFGKIARIVQTIEVAKTPLEKKIDELSVKIAVVTIFFALLIIIIGLFRGEGIINMILAGISLAVSVIPEGLPAVMAVTLALAIGRMQKHNVLIRRLPAAETLGRTTVICVDKTGTLTEEEMTVSKFYCNHEFYSIKGNSFYHENNKINPLKVGDIEKLLKIGIMCNNARIEKKDSKLAEVFGEPTEKSLIVSADKAGLFKQEQTEKEIRLKEYSFSSKRKMMSIVRQDSSGKIISYVKGAPDSVLKHCTHELFNGRVINLTTSRKQELITAHQNMASQALRVLGFAYREVTPNFNQETAETNLIFVGLQGIIDPPRKEVADAIKDCLSAGIKVKMITGDSILTAEAISKLIGLDGGSIEGKELEKLSESEFSDIVRTKTIFARITPEIKYRIVQTLKKQNEIVAVTGDGINDVLALKDAHIGIAMGIRGTDVARESSDIILLDDNFSSIVKAVKEGRRVYDNLNKSIKFNLAANINELFLVFFALLLAFPLPMIPVAILWINLITDTLPSLSLGFEPAEEDIMKRKPIRHEQSILKTSASFIFFAGTISFIVSMALFLFYYKFSGDINLARTIATTSCAVSEFFLIFTCKSNDKNVWKVGAFSNMFLVYAVASAFILQMIAIYFSPLAAVFSFVPLSFSQLAITILFSSAAFVFFEAKKFISSVRVEK